MASLLRRVRSWLARQIAPTPSPSKSRPRGQLRMRGSYDAADGTVENDDRWPSADSLSSNAALDPATRQALRERSRNECQNNSYAAGLVEGIATDLVGTGPRLQLTIPGVSREVCQQIEAGWANWCHAADLADDLRILHQTRLRDGEAFALIIDNPALVATGTTPVTLDLKLYESEQVSDPWDFGLDPLYVDGILSDANGNRLSYTFLKYHPGGTFAWGAYLTEKFEARDVLHWYKPDRPGQVRGVPMLAPGLPLFAQLRRYTLATLTAAEVAATLAGVMKTNAPADAGAEVEVTALQDIDLVRGALLTLPNEWDAVQFKPEQPVSTYSDFKGQILNEIGRGCGVPFNVVSGNSSGYNYSSGRLDHILYQKAVLAERARLERRILDPLFVQFIFEFIRCSGLRAVLPALTMWRWKFHWDGFGTLDPQKDAQTDQIELSIGTTTLAEIHARKGQDWETAMRQRAAELSLAQSLETDLGLPPGSLSGLEAAPAAPAAAQPEATDDGSAPTDETADAGEPAAA